MYEVRLKPKAQKFIQKLQNKFQRQVLDSIKLLENNPRPQDSLCLNSQKKVYRIDKGQYRILYQIRDKQSLVVVATVKDRKDIYKNLQKLIKNFPHLLVVV